MYSKTVPCEHKIDTDSDGNLMPIAMFKMLFSNTTGVDLYKCIDTKVVLCTYNNSFISQMGICKVAIAHKGITFQCRFL